MDVFECASSPCQNGVLYKSTVNASIPYHTYTCACTQGWAGENCNIDVDECASDPCQNGARCVESGCNTSQFYRGQYLRISERYAEEQMLKTTSGCTSESKLSRAVAALPSIPDRTPGIVTILPQAGTMRVHGRMLSLTTMNVCVRTAWVVQMGTQ